MREAGGNIPPALSLASSRSEPFAPGQLCRNGKQWPRGDEGLGKMRDWVNARPGSRLTIVDTLAVVRPPSRASESVHSADYAALRGMHQLANEHGISKETRQNIQKAMNQLTD